MSIPKPGDPWPKGPNDPDYGLTDEVPRVVRVNDEGHVPCPKCGCRTTCEVEIALTVAKFKTGKGVGRFSGCPACDWKSPMDVIEGRGY